MVKVALIAAALAVVGVCGVQIGWVISHHGVTQVSEHSAPAKGKIVQVDGGGGM